MPLDSDVVLLGTGVAPLVAAYHLLEKGASVLLLNTDGDFFHEQSELPFEVFWPGRTRTIDADKFKLNLSEITFEVLRPSFPGAIEFWGADRRLEGFHDPAAPHVRERDQIWSFENYEISAIPSVRAEWDAIESLFLDASDKDLNPEILDSRQTCLRFPGSAREMGDFKSLWVPRFCDVDVARYCNGIHEFVRERLGEDRLLCGVNSIELTPDGIRFSAREKTWTSRTPEIWTFWTPRMTPWVFSHLGESNKLQPDGVRVWEEWRLLSKDRLIPHVIGNYKGMAAWADVEGRPSVEGSETLNILRPGALLPLGRYNEHLEWAAQTSFEEMSQLCSGFLGWDGFTIRGMKPRALFEWTDEAEVQDIDRGGRRLRLIPHCDGSLARVVRNARRLVEQYSHE